jgi:hypothetical protein
MNIINDYESFKEKLDQHEKIIEILAGVSSFIPNLYVINNNSDFSDAVRVFCFKYFKVK